MELGLQILLGYFLALMIIRKKRRN